MKSIKELKNTMPQKGSIEWISVRPKRRADVIEVTDVEVTVEKGLTGDHYGKQGGNRMVTLIQAEHLEVIARIMKKEVRPDMLRRNIMVSGINLKALQDGRFRIGDDVILEGTGNCVPCSRMEETLGEGGYNVMRGHGGITTKVIQGGKIKNGDVIRLVIE